jgi:molybdopterin molybdotransferase
MSSGLPSYAQAAAVVAKRSGELARHPAAERVKLAFAAGRILARPLRADRDQPPFPRSTRDGFACRAAEASTHKTLRVAGSTRAGQAPAGALPADSAWEIMTGAPVPDGADAVAMVEHVERMGDAIRLRPPRALAPGENIVPQGAEARAGEEVLPTGVRLRPAQIALAAAFGYAELEVSVRPRVAILATGDELVSVSSLPGAGQIRNSNAPMLAALVAEAGGEPWILPTAQDNDQALDSALAQAAEADLLLITGGVSAGRFDLVEPALARAGARFHFTGIRIQPGKPLVFGELPRDVRAGSTPSDGGLTLPFFGLPGNPISSAATFLLFAVPMLAALSGSRQSGPRFALAQLGKRVHGNPDLTRFVPAKCNFSAPDGQLPEVAPVGSQGSGDLVSFSRSNCFLVVPEGAGHLEAGAIVSMLLF